MTRYYITHQTLTYDCGYVTVHMRSNTIQHLWLLYTTRGPSIEEIPDKQQKSNVPHQNNYKIYVDGVVEQEEPGNTQQHTFTFALPANNPVVFFYTINQGTAPIKASRSPIFAYEFEPTTTWEETWLPGINSVHSFTFDFVPGLNDPVTGIYSLRLFSAEIGLSGVTRGIAHLGNSFSAIMPTFNSCGALFTITVPESHADPPYGSPYVWLTLRTTTGPEWATNIVFKTGGATEAPFDTPPPINVFPIIVPPGQHSFSLDQILTLRHTAYPNTTPPGMVEATLIEVASGGHSPQIGYFQEYDFGPITLSHVDQAPRDISKFWRSRRPAPVLR